MTVGETGTNTSGRNAAMQATSGQRRGLLASAPALLRRRRIQITALALLTFAGAVAAGGWGWLAATGLAPALLSVAPCTAICALGLCMGRRSHGRGYADSVAGRTADRQP